MNIKKILGNNLKRLRKNSGLTLELLAEKLELSYQVLSKIEKGQQFITADNFEKICNFFRVEPAALLKTDKNIYYGNATLDNIILVLNTMTEKQQKIIYNLLIAYEKSTLKSKNLN